MEMKSFPTEYFAQNTPVRRQNPPGRIARFEQQSGIPIPANKVEQKPRAPPTRAVGSGRERVKNEMANSFTRNEEISILPGFKQKSSERLPTPFAQLRNSAIEDASARYSSRTNTSPGLYSKDRNTSHHYENLPADNDKEKYDRATAQTLYKQELDRQIEERNNLRQQEAVKYNVINEKANQTEAGSASSENTTGYLPSWFDPPEKFKGTGTDDYSSSRSHPQLEQPMQQYQSSPNPNGIPNFFPMPPAHSATATSNNSNPEFLQRTGTPRTPGGNLGFLDPPRPIAPSVSQGELLYMQQKLEMTYLQQQSEMAILEKQKEMAFLQRRNEEAYMQTCQRQSQLAHLMKLQEETSQSINDINILPPPNNLMFQTPTQYASAQVLATVHPPENSMSTSSRTQTPNSSIGATMERRDDFRKSQSPSPSQQSSDQADAELTRLLNKNLIKSHVSQTAEQRPDDTFMKEEYSKQLLRQIEERKRMEEERIAAERAEEEKFHRRILEDQAKMKREYEEEMERLRRKAEELEERQQSALKINEMAKKEAEKLKKHRRPRSQLTITVDPQENKAQEDTELKPSEMGMGDQITNEMAEAESVCIIDENQEEEHIDSNEPSGDQPLQQEPVVAAPAVATSPAIISATAPTIIPRKKRPVPEPKSQSQNDDFKILRKIRLTIANEEKRMEKVVEMTAAEIKEAEEAAKAESKVMDSEAPKSESEVDVEEEEVEEEAEAEEDEEFEEEEVEEEEEDDDDDEESEVED